MNIKYTTDNKKVVVLDKINTTQSIVKEIFIVDGDEVPLGDKFIATGLLDSPNVKSWKENDIAERERIYELKAEKLKKLEDDISKEQKKLRSMFDYLRQLNDKYNNDVFNRLELFLSGKIQYVILQQHRTYKVMSFSDSIDNEERHDNHTLKLITLFGRSDGNLEFNINQYSDGSGYSHKNIIELCESHEDLIKKLTPLIKSEINEDNIKLARKYNIHIESELIKPLIDKISQQMSSYLVEQTKVTQRGIDSYKKQLEFLE